MHNQKTMGKRVTMPIEQRIIAIGGKISGKI